MRKREINEKSFSYTKANEKTNKEQILPTKSEDTKIHQADEAESTHTNSDF